MGGPTCTALDGRAGHGPAGQGRRWPFFCSDHPQSISSRPAGENTVARGVAGAGRWPARHGHGVEPNRSDTRLGGTVGGVSATWGGPMTNPPAVRTRGVRTTSRVVRDAGVRPGMRGKSNLVMVSTINVQESSYSSGLWDAISPRGSVTPLWFADPSAGRLLRASQRPGPLFIPVVLIVACTRFTDVLIKGIGGSVDGLLHVHQVIFQQLQSTVRD